jgi:putative ABC transport system permease protein
MKVIAGRTFAEAFTQDMDTSIVVAESTSKLLGFSNPEDAIGQTISFPSFQWSAIIVGVVNDYHQESLKKALDPAVFYCTKYGGEFYSVRFNTNNLTETVEGVRQAWSKAFPGNPMDYFFLDDYFNQQYENEMKFGKLFTTFSIVAVIVACLGLFGLSAYTATQRTKEIGIRKALGSSDRGIFILLSQEYVKLIALAIVVASPLVWWIMNNWVQGFPYRTTISPVIFIIAGVAVLLVALLTVSFQTIKAARVNPVESLRYE